MTTTMKPSLALCARTWHTRRDLVVQRGSLLKFQPSRDRTSGPPLAAWRAAASAPRADLLSRLLSLSHVHHSALSSRPRGRANRAAPPCEAVARAECARAHREASELAKLVRRASNAAALAIKTTAGTSGRAAPAEEYALMMRARESEEFSEAMQARLRRTFLFIFFFAAFLPLFFSLPLPFPFPVFSLFEAQGARSSRRPR